MATATAGIAPAATTSGFATSVAGFFSSLFIETVVFAEMGAIVETGFAASAVGRVTRASARATAEDNAIAPASPLLFPLPCPRRKPARAAWVETRVFPAFSLCADPLPRADPASVVSRSAVAPVSLKPARLEPWPEPSEANSDCQPARKLSVPGVVEGKKP
jgi:hypothetical protein